MPEHKTAYIQMCSEGYNIELEFTGCKLHFFEENYSGGRHTLHVQNSNKIKMKHGVVVSEHETKEHKVAFRYHRLMDDFDPLHYGYN